MVLGFGIEAEDRFACLTLIAQQKFHQVGLALTAVAEDKNIAVCLILGTLIKVHKHVAAVLISADIEAVFIGLS